MRKIIVISLIGLFFLVGLGILFYPMIADYVNARNQSRVIASYYDDIAQISEEDYTQLIEEATEYNMSLLTNKSRFKFTDEDREKYNKLLTPKGKQVMGILEIEAIGVKLPIYHGTSEGVLQVGIGHIEGSSLPIGGLGTHSALSGHRGLPSATLLTHLDKLIVGDTFTLHILNEVLTYQVDQIVVTEPDDMSEMAIDEDKDYCTLVTCTPYGINSHRMLVRGVRIETIEATDVKPTVNRILESDAYQYNTFAIVGTVTAIALIPSVIVGIISYVRYSMKIKKLIKKLKGGR